jgi:hypothetical protein
MPHIAVRLRKETSMVPDRLATADELPGGMGASVTMGSAL